MQIIDKKTARSEGLKHYYTGKPCKQGHDSERYVNDGKCAQCVRDRVAKWKADDPERSKAVNRRYYYENRDVLLEKKATYREEHREELNAWKREYYNSDAGRLERKLYRENNIERIREMKRDYYARNIEQEREQRRRDYEKHKEKRAAAAKIYQMNNRDKLNHYYRNRRRNDLDFKLSTYIRNMVGRLVQRGYDKTKLTSEILGYDVAQLKSHIEVKFEDGMNWENYGEWHIDHIVPVVQMVKQGITDPAIVNALSNLQPLWAFDNLSKGGR